MIKLLKNKKGFTLIELIVVIAILGILAIITIPNISGFTDKAKETADIAAAETIAKAISILVAEGTISDTETITYDGSKFDEYNEDIMKLVDKIKFNREGSITFTIEDGKVTYSLNKENK